MYQKKFNDRSPRTPFRGKPYSKFSNSRRPFSNGPSQRPFANSQKKKGGQMGMYIDPSKFVHKAVITEETEHFVPEHRFADFAIGEDLKRAIASKGYTTPTPIQDRTIALTLQGRDVVGIANTGTGKTAAFLVPLINKVLLNQREQVLVVVPTRELAIQIESELKGITRGMRIFSVCCVGGAPIGPQLAALRNRNQFIIGIDFFKTKSFY